MKLCTLLIFIFLIACDSSSNKNTNTNENETQSMVCTPNKERCNGDIKQSCNLLGQWEDVACPSKYTCLEIDGSPICQEIQFIEDMNVMADQGGSQVLEDMNMTEGGNDIAMTDMMTIACIEKISIAEVCHPNADCCDNGLICIANAERSDIGICQMNVCPIASTPVTEFDALPLDIINLDASTSTDADSPNGKPVSYEWTVLQRPNGSTAQIVERYNDPARPADGGLPDDTSTPNALFFVDLAGEYQISLKVKDALGFSAPSNECSQQEVVVLIHAIPNEDIHIQLVWHTPQDSDETDEFGTDVDLHFFHPQSMLTNPSRSPTWATLPYDCYYENTNPEWGPQGPTANPSLDIDDISGAGPENINLDQPEDTSRLGENYRVGVHYFKAESDFNTAWASEVTTRIYINGSLAGEWSTTLRTTDQHWEVASIIWSPQERRAIEINRVY